MRLYRLPTPRTFVSAPRSEVALHADTSDNRASRLPRHRLSALNSHFLILKWSVDSLLVKRCKLAAGIDVDSANRAAVWTGRPENLTGKETPCARAFAASC